MSWLAIRGRRRICQGYLMSLEICFRLGYLLLFCFNAVLLRVDLRLFGRIALRFEVDCLGVFGVSEKGFKVVTAASFGELVLWDGFRWLF